MERQITKNLPTPGARIKSRLNPETLQLTTGRVPVSGMLNPWTTERVSEVGWEGESLRALLLRLSGGLEIPSHAVVCVGDRVVPSKYWKNVYPNAGVPVTVNLSVGDSEVLRAVALIAVGVASIYTGGLAGVAYGPLAGTAATVGTMAVGVLAIDAFIPLAQPKFASSRTSQVLSIAGSRNVETPFSPVPQILGTYRYTPPLAAPSFTSLNGADQNLTMLVTPGRGPLYLDLATFRIKDTLLSDFDDYILEVNEGYADDPVIELYPSLVEQLPLNIRVYNGTWRQSGPVHPDPNPCLAVGPTLPPGASVMPNCYVRTTPIPCKTIRVDMTQPSGGIRIKDQGDRINMTVVVELWYRVSGIDPYILGATHTEVSKTSSLLRYSLRVEPDPGGSEAVYDVLVRRITLDDQEGEDPDRDNSRWSACWWTSLTAISNSDPIIGSTGSCISQIALEIQATGQLNGIIDEFNLIGSTVCLDYDGSPGVWVRRTTSNPASLFRYALQGDSNPDPMNDCRIDLVAIEQWHDFCQARGFKFDMVRDFQSSVLDCLRDIAAAGRARPDQIDGLWTVVVDNQANYVGPVQLFSPRNSWGFSTSRRFIDQPHAFRVRFVDSENDYKQTEKIAYDEGYDEGNATRFESIEFPGITTWRNNECMAKYRLAEARLRSEGYVWNADFEQLVCVQGDSVLVQEDSIRVGTGAARVESISGNDVILDDWIEVPVAPAIVNRQSSTGAIRTDAVTAAVAAGEYTNTFTYGVLPPEVQLGNLMTVGELNSETLHIVVDTILPKNDEAATLHGYLVAPATDIICT